MKKRKILFLGETNRADAITWMNGLKQFGDFEIVTWELKSSNNSFYKIKRIFEFIFSYYKLKNIIKLEKPDMIIAERTTSYGFLAAISGIKTIAIAQQGITDLWPIGSLLIPFKRILQNHAFKKATIIHAWGEAMSLSMKNCNVDMKKVLILPKGINIENFQNNLLKNDDKIRAIVTRSLTADYRHEIILKAFSELNNKNIDFSLDIVGDGNNLIKLKKLSKELNIDNKVNFLGRISNSELPILLQKSNFYISMPITEGVSASLFEAMATGCYPIVTNIVGNQHWIKHKQNGQLIYVDNYLMLADEIIWAFENKDYRNKVVLTNRIFVEQNVDYKKNMQFIANKYHELINITQTN
jgi:glycosyltransferase involved in cell wall biosynthesis